MIQYLRLPFDLDVNLLRREALALANDAWKQHYNPMNHIGGWSALPLYAIDGNANSIHSLHSGGIDPTRIEYRPTPLLEACPYLASILQRLPFPKRAVRLMRLEAGAIIKEHADQDLAFEDGEVRFHVPVQTNDLVEFYVNNERIRMNEGELWYLNLSLPHRVSNLGTTDRIHLVIDGVVSDWLREQFARPDLETRKDIEKPKPVYDEATRRMIAEELRRIGSAKALEMAETFQP